MRRLTLTIVASTALAACSNTGSPITATGSSTVEPFTQEVAKAFVEADPKRTKPVVDAVGTSPGIARFCAGPGDETPDIVNASRRMKRDEYTKCQANKVGDVMELPIGLDGIALAESNQGPKIALTRQDIYLALAANPNGKPNTAKTWRDVNASLPAIPIKVLGPPKTSGTHELFIDLMLEPGCHEATPEAKDLQGKADPAVYASSCRTLRTDGAYVAEGEDDNVTVQALEKNPQALGVFGYSYLEQNATRLHGVAIDGVTPDPDSIASGKYPGMRTLYLYVKNAHLKHKPALQDFLNLYASMSNPGGPLTKIGLVAQSDKSRRLAANILARNEPLDTTALP